jgi:hypothetical protein
MSFFTVHEKGHGHQHGHCLGLQQHGHGHGHRHTVDTEINVGAFGCQISFTCKGLI